MKKGKNQTAKESLEDLATTMAKGISVITTHPRLVDILRGHSVHDGEVPVLSVEMVALLSEVILRDEKLLNQIESIVYKDDYRSAEIEAFELIATHIKETEKLQWGLLIKNAVREITRRKYRWRDRPEFQNIHLWFPLVDKFRNPQKPVERLVAEKMIGLIVSRALFDGDHQLLSALSEATKEAYLERYDRPPHTQSLVSHIIDLFDIVVEDRGTPPSKSELKLLIQTLDQDASDDFPVWSNAWKESGLFESTKDRSRKADTYYILRLARLLKDAQ
jgi:phosphoglycolate phosphatase-like HAD superfamily hydrolase